MNLSQQLAQRYREVILDGKWIANTNFQDQLADVTWEESIQQVATLNTLAALTFHIGYYTAGLNQVFAGGDLEIRDRFSFDFSPIESPQDWDQLRNQLWTGAAEFVEHLERMPESQLSEGFVKPEYGTYLRNIEGMIEHAYYHLGQVVLIKKLIRQ
ncbi:hypothetical protein [Pontibacter sp. G13]|uniref:hypothetical protein n=1 Tax=Pontibacter sp. G13 TaxID=3074898 RepID=UPI00288B800C|nr:hypothetical protein [Pontibacter sp. G13]WNJ18322.1 hypothetical protein RJD25_26005 [Pontibacter sp. G13]